MRVGYNPGVEEPPAHTIVWRYMDFGKLASIFMRKELFFAGQTNSMIPMKEGYLISLFSTG
jgi:hypothetical protein